MKQDDEFRVRRGFYRGVLGWWISGGAGDTAWTTWKPTLAEWERAILHPETVDPWEDVTIGAPRREP